MMAVEVGGGVVYELEGALYARMPSCNLRKAGGKPITQQDLDRLSDHDRALLERHIAAVAFLSGLKRPRQSGLPTLRESISCRSSLAVDILSKKREGSVEQSVTHALQQAQDVLVWLGFQATIQDIAKAGVLTVFVLVILVILGDVYRGEIQNTFHRVRVIAHKAKDATSNPALREALQLPKYMVEPTLDGIYSNALFYYRYRDHLGRLKTKTASHLSGSPAGEESVQRRECARSRDALSHLR